MVLRKQFNKERAIIKMRVHVKPIELSEISQRLEQDKLEFLKAIYAYYKSNGTNKKIRLTSESTLLVAEAQTQFPPYAPEEISIDILFSDGTSHSEMWDKNFIKLIERLEEKVWDKKGLAMVIDTEKDYKPIILSKEEREKRKKGDK